MATCYHRRTYHVPAAAEESFAAELVARGSLGCETRDAGDASCRVVAYFAQPPPAAAAAWHAGWPGVRLEDAATFPASDWLAAYRAAVRPVELGERFLVDPGDGDGDGGGGVPGAAGRHLLKIPARTAFGTGSHESTRLAVHWLEEIAVRGRDVLDVGTGSGILAFVALVLGARRAVGFDVDAGAVLVAHANRAANGLFPALFAGRLDALREDARFDLALVNVLPQRILAEMPEIARRLRDGGRLVSSGNLTGRRRELVERFAACGLAVLGEKTDGDWLAFLFEKRGPP